ncbi:MAG TPA: GntR family transcriptional regulator [Candidatus Pelethocola excrementipullorum]|nr:GntR family transcriptional regulator [Candidatus Pelethocola excrementipullorum]
MKLDTDNLTPLYQQLKEEIKLSITSGNLKPGQKIPTETELSDKYDISRITVRRAIEELCQEDFLIKKQGKGTFVKYQKIQRKIAHLMSFSEACEANGMTPSSKVTHKGIIYADHELAKEMGMETGDQAIFIQRVRLADGVPVMCENNYFPYDSYSFLLDEPLNDSLYELLKRKYQIEVSYSQDSYIDVIRSTGDLSQLLQVTNGEPLFFLFTKMYDTKHRLVHVGKQYIISSRYRFYLDESSNR